MVKAKKPTGTGEKIECYDRAQEIDVSLFEKSGGQVLDNGREQDSGDNDEVIEIEGEDGSWCICSTLRYGNF